MLEFIRGHRRILQFVLLLFIVPSFVVVGAWDMISPGAGQSTLATVDGRAIDRVEWDRAHRNTLDNLAAQLGGRVAISGLDTPAARIASLDRLIQDRMLAVAAAQSGLSPSDESIKQLVSQIPEFQKAGQFDLATAKAFLAQRGLTTDQFEVNLRRDLASEMLPRALADSAIASRMLARRLALLDTETRLVRLQRFSNADFQKGLSPATGDLERFYQEQQSRYQTPERMDLELVVLASPDSAERVERFTNLVYEQSETYESVGRDLKLPIYQIKDLGRDGQLTQSGLPPAVLAVLRDPKFLSSIFVPQVIADRRNTEAIELQGRRWVSGRVVAHRPAQTLPMASVSSQLQADWLRAEASKRAIAAAQAWTTAQISNSQSGQSAKGQPAKASAAPGSSGSPGSPEGRLVTLARSNLSQAGAALGLQQPADISAVAQKIFDPKLAPGFGEVVSLRSEPAVVAFVLVEQRLEGPSAPSVQQRLGPAFEFVQRYERDQAIARWLRDLEPRLKVKRYADKLAAAAS